MSSDDDLAQRAARHMPVTVLSLGASVCHACRQSWPCDASLNELGTCDTCGHALGGHTGRGCYFPGCSCPVTRNEQGALEQIERLATYIMAEVPGEPSQSQGAVDTAIRVLGDLREQLAAEQAARAQAEAAVVLLCQWVGWNGRRDWLDRWPSCAEVEAAVAAALAGEEGR